MLLAVEGGGFFSSSASGYSKGLTLLLLGGQKEEDNKRMKVSPWNQYNLVDHEPESGLQFASRKKWRRRLLSKAWLPFICLGCASGGGGGVNASSPHKVGGAKPQEEEEELSTAGDNHEDSDVETSAAPKSNLKRRTNANAHEREALVENVSDISGHDVVARRKVQWTDAAAGTELVEIREFEPSEIGESEDESESKNLRSCSCTIM